jgi:signal transduction histidine kinase
MWALAGKIVDYFVPSEARGESSNFMMFRTFVFLHLLGPLLGQSVIVFLYRASEHISWVFWAIEINLCFFWLMPWVVRSTRSLVLPATLSVNALVTLSLFGSFFYGGISSPFLPWILIALLLGFFYLADRTATVLAGVAIQLGIFTFAHFLYDFPQLLPLESMWLPNLLSILSALIYMTLVALYYENVMRESSALEQAAHAHRRRADELRQAMLQAEHASHQKSIFLAKMSHELRTPLNAVIGYSEILLEDAELKRDSAQIEDLRRINAAGKHLLSLVTSVLDLSKIEADKTELVVEPFDVASFIEDVVATSRSLVVANHNEFVIERSPDLGIMISDATKLRQSVLNLLSNAGKFTKDGRITLNVARERGTTGDWIRICIEDNGIGITADNVQKLFKDFNQAEASTSTKYGGTGLGLALSQSLCRMMGGAITVESTYGRGSRFTIRVPAYIEDEEASQRKRATASSERRVLRAG